jgi:hypothetical protein
MLLWRRWGTFAFLKITLHHGVSWYKAEVFGNSVTVVHIDLVRLCHRKCASSGLFCIPQMVYEYEAVAEWYEKGKIGEFGGKVFPVSFCPPQVPRGLVRAQTLSSAVRSRRLTAWIMVWRIGVTKAGGRNCSSSQMVIVQAVLVWCSERLGSCTREIMPSLFVRHTFLLHS